MKDKRTTPAERYAETAPSDEWREFIRAEVRRQHRNGEDVSEIVARWAGVARESGAGRRKACA